MGGDPGTSEMTAVNNHLKLKTSRDQDDMYFSTGNLSSNRMIIKGATGYIGIGSTSPNYFLDIRSGGGTSRQMHLGDEDGVMSIGGNNKGQFLINGGRSKDGNYSTTHGVGIHGLNGDILFQTISGVTSGTLFNPAVRMKIAANGDIGIGTTDTQGFKLGVDGKIAATEVKVATYSNWPDYVFKDTYSLPALEEVEQ